MNMKIVIPVIVGVIAVSGLAYVIAPSDEITVTEIEIDKTVLEQQFDYPKGAPILTAKIIDVPVGAKTNTHTHDYPLFVYILDGEITVDYGEGSKTFTKGETFVEAIDYFHFGINNGDKPTKILAVELGEK